ncbi:MAG: M24 family metallopeptidase [Eubacteriales bacterium]|nr:M24 family metallopeptidase [Eubacteriales bacterium]
MLSVMKEKELDVSIIYADKEHFHNFKFFTGFDPRFEEGLLIIHCDGEIYVALGNECLGQAERSSIPLTTVLCQVFSLPNQPMDEFDSMSEVFNQCNLTQGMRVALIDWKLFTVSFGNEYMTTFGMPSYIVDAVKHICGNNIVNGTSLLIDPDYGLRIINSVHTIAGFEYYSTIASQSVKDMIQNARPGMNEMEIALQIRTYGQPVICHPSVKSGENARKSLISPTSRKMKLGDELSFTLGMEGGLSSRKGYLAFGPEDLPLDGQLYMEDIVKPYMATVFNWYQMIKIGRKFGEIYKMVEETFPKNKFGWSLNPGHYIASEEWVSSPIYKNSKIEMKSGMMLQMDIIPSDPVYSAPKCEDGICIADANLRKQLLQSYPEVYKRCMSRRTFMQEQLGINLAPEVLPMSNLAGEFRPYFLRYDKAIRCR